MEDVKFPMTLGYLKDTDTEWGHWEVVRELVQNAMDASDDWTVKLEGDKLTVSNGGESMSLKQLLIGFSDKKIDNPRGQYGEGLKLAMMVCTRLGLRIDVKTGKLRIHNERAEMFGEETFKIVWEEVEEDHPGTQCTIEGWFAPDFHLRFVGPYTKVLHDAAQSGSILQQRKLFDKDIWVQDLDDYYYGYNLPDVKLNRDRNVADSYTLRTSIGKLWGNVANVRLWSDLFMAIETGSAEKDMNMYTWSVSTEVEGVIREAFEMVYGSKAVIETSPSRANHAKYLGAKPVSIRNSDLTTLLKRIVQTDEEYIQENAKRSREDDAESPEEFLSDYELETLQGLRRIADKVTSRKVVPYVMSPGTSGKWVDGEIKVNSSILSDRKESLITLIHEVAHANTGANDLTVELLEAIQSTASDMFIGTVWNTY